MNITITTDQGTDDEYRRIVLADGPLAATTRED